MPKRQTGPGASGRAEDPTPRPPSPTYRAPLCCQLRCSGLPQEAGGFVPQGHSRPSSGLRVHGEAAGGSCPPRRGCSPGPPQRPREHGGWQSRTGISGNPEETLAPSVLSGPTPAEAVNGVPSQDWECPAARTSTDLLTLRSHRRRGPEWTPKQPISE